jgi:hypothetical protein
MQSHNLFISSAIMYAYMWENIHERLEETKVVLSRNDNLMKEPYDKLERLRLLIYQML